jgi:hypothetical protein
MPHWSDWAWGLGTILAALLLALIMVKVIL